jgi:hypothetical protein
MPTSKLSVLDIKDYQLAPRQRYQSLSQLPIDTV